MKTISQDVIRFEDGSINRDATVLAFTEALSEVSAKETVDFDTIGTQFCSYLLNNPGLRTVSTSVAVQRLYDMTVDEAREAGKPLSDSEKDGVKARLETVLPEYIKQNSDLFHTGKKIGILVHHVPGELNDKGEQAFRCTQEDWDKAKTSAAVSAAKAKLLADAKAAVEAAATKKA